MSKSDTIRLTKKQKEVIKKMKEGYFLWENLVTANRRWALSKEFDGSSWGIINGLLAVSLLHLVVGERHNEAVKKYSLNEAGKNIKL